MSDLGQLFLGVAILINAVMSVVTFFITRNAANALELLEKNTNSIKDALVKVTGESEFAKGKLEGKAEPKGERK
jgi:hypothetical protein